MKVAILYFSGTGNTHITAENIAGALKKKGADVSCNKIENIIDNLDSIKLDEFDYIIIGYPIHAFNAPQMVVKFAKQMPKSAGQKIFIFKTSGEPFRINNASSYLIYKHLINREYEVRYEEHFLMPYNIVFRYKDSLVKQMYLVMEKMSDEFALKIFNNNTENILFHIGARIISFVFRIQWYGAKLNGLFYSSNRKKCILCLKCVNNCPSKNINNKNGKIKFHNKCMMCMRCVQNCPTFAINIGIIFPLAVKGVYNFKKIVNDDNILSNYINNDTKGYFKLFRKFYDKHN